MMVLVYVKKKEILPRRGFVAECTHIGLGVPKDPILSPRSDMPDFDLARSLVRRNEVKKKVRKYIFRRKFE